MGKISSAAYTHIGNIRMKNEDNLYVNGWYKGDIAIEETYHTDDQKREEYLYSVCDGMGGESFGEVASLIAVQTLKEYENQAFHTCCQSFIDTANERICRKMAENGVRVGTTFAALNIAEGSARAYNLGDSRIYFFRGGVFRQLTKDHTQAQSLADMGLIRKEETKHHRDRNILTQNLGVFPEEFQLQVHLSKEIQIRDKDTFLLCSDGLTDMVEDDRICRILKQKKKPIYLARELTQEALNNGGRDNISVIVVKIQG